jgi:uncharacterized protein
VKAVFDTNVLIAAFAAEGLCAKLLFRARKRELSLLLCPIILDEFEKILQTKLRASSSEIREAMELVREAADEILMPGNEAAGVCRDRDDDLVLSCALSARADFLVTGDADLLVLGSFREVAIVTPRQFEGLFPD